MIISNHYMTDVKHSAGIHPRSGYRHSPLREISYDTGLALVDTDTKHEFNIEHTDNTVIASAGIAAPFDCKYTDTSVPLPIRMQSVWMDMLHSNKSAAERVRCSFQIQLPKGISRKENAILCKRIAEEYAKATGCVITYGFHDKPNNPHMHVSITERRLEPDGTFCNKKSVTVYVDNNGNVINGKTTIDTNGKLVTDYTDENGNDIRCPLTIDGKEPQYEIKSSIVCSNQIKSNGRLQWASVIVDGQRIYKDKDGNLLHPDASGKISFKDKDGNDIRMPLVPPGANPIYEIQSRRICINQKKDKSNRLQWKRKSRGGIIDKDDLIHLHAIYDEQVNKTLEKYNIRIQRRDKEIVKRMQELGFTAPVHLGPAGNTEDKRYNEFYYTIENIVKKQLEKERYFENLPAVAKKLEIEADTAEDEFVQSLELEKEYAVSVRTEQQYAIDLKKSVLKRASKSLNIQINNADLNVSSNKSPAEKIYWTTLSKQSAKLKKWIDDNIASASVDLFASARNSWNKLLSDSKAAFVLQRYGNDVSDLYKKFVTRHKTDGAQRAVTTGLALASVITGNAAANIRKTNVDILDALNMHQFSTSILNKNELDLISIACTIPDRLEQIVNNTQPRYSNAHKYYDPDRPNKERNACIKRITDTYNTARNELIKELVNNQMSAHPAFHQDNIMKIFNDYADADLIKNADAVKIQTETFKKAKKEYDLLQKPVPAPGGHGTEQTNSRGNGYNARSGR